MATKKKNRITKKQIQQALSSCVFNPNETGPMKMIIDNAFDNSDFNQALNYLEIKAKELIEEGRLSIREDNINPYKNNRELNLSIYNEKLSKAICLLAIAKCLRV